MYEPKITTQVDCENSPRMQYIKDFNVAFARQDVEGMLGAVSDDITWNMVGDKVIKGKNDFHAALEQMAGGEITELIINNIISHGDTCASDGVMIFADGTKIAFCDIYRFSSHAKDARISQMTSYAVDIK